ncbi:MAG: BBP7 family outer membrane beta-barrel protein [Gemmataceae bacterium]|jgi:hypothetical protein|nr:BBP7 family outer membrane beta-barrel protein [Gemmataceae bacterium]
MDKRIRLSICLGLVFSGSLLAQQGQSLPLPPIPPPPSELNDTPAFMASPSGSIQPVQGVAPLPPVKSPPAAPPTAVPDPLMTPPEGSTTLPPWWNNAPPVSGTPVTGRPTTPYVVDGGRRPSEIVVVESRFWYGADFLMLFGKGYNTPPLVGIIRDSNSSVIDNIYPDERLGTGPFSAVRMYGGLSFDTDGLTSGFDVSYTHVFDRTVTEQFGHANGQVLGRPFVDANTGIANLLQATTSDGFLRGSIVVKSHTEMNGGEIRYFISDASQFGEVFQWLVGFRYFRLADRLRSDFRTEIPTAQLGLHLHDEFRTTNRAYLTQVGVRGGYSAPRWFINGELKVGLGVIAQRGVIEGSTTAGNGGATLPSQLGGLLALSGNIGNYEQSRFGVMPEVMLQFGYRITPSLTLLAGYEFMFLNSVIRPGGLIDGTVNTDRVPSVNLNPVLSSPVRPAPVFSTESFWLQGISLGIQYRF